MKLFEILSGIEFDCRDNSLLSCEVSDIKIDHRLVEKGDVFIAIHGEKHNGNDFIKEAEKRGALCTISDEGRGDFMVKNARSAYAIACKNFFGRACDSLKIIAVTGTNGKTTTSIALADMLRGGGYKAGVIGTLGARVNDTFQDTGFTTPDPYILHKIFAQMLANGNEFVVMEASAHALALDKLEGINFEAGVLTNITEDHLDFFKDMQAYTNAKLKLFDRSKLAIFCDKDGLSDLIKGRWKKALSYGLSKDADFSAHVLEKSFDGSHFTCKCGESVYDLKSPLVGDYNIENTLAALAVCKGLGLSDEQILRGISAIKPVEGRFNIIKGEANIVVDYAHTPDGLENVLTTASRLGTGRVVVVFGCGGNRDKLKRPIMGRIASLLADEVILTDDNPRFEDSLAIIEDIKKGVKGKCKVIPDRRKAIEYALKTYHSGETIIIAGKGAEKYQEIKGVKYPYSDFEVIEAWRNCKEMDSD